MSPMDANAHGWDGRRSSSSRISLSSRVSIDSAEVERPPRGTEERPKLGRDRYEQWLVRETM
jgi:hypothetical protein